MTKSDPKNNVFVEGRQLATDAETVSTSSIQDSGDGQAWETLQEAGYQNGDKLVIGPFNFKPDSDITTSNTNYETGTTVVGIPFNLIPDGATVNLLYVVASTSNLDTKLTDRDTSNDITGTEILGGAGSTQPVTAEATDVAFDSLETLDVNVRSQDGTTARLYGRGVAPAIYLTVDI